jgi:hypothetical protein
VSGADVTVPRAALEVIVAAARRASRVLGYVDTSCVPVVAAGLVDVDLIAAEAGRLLGPGETPRQTAERAASRLEDVAPTTVWRSVDAPRPSRTTTIADIAEHQRRRLARGTDAPDATAELVEAKRGAR